MYSMLGSYVKSMFNNYSNDDIIIGSDVIIEMIIEYINDSDNLDNIRFYIIKELDLDNVINEFINIKKNVNKFNNNKIGKKVYELLNI